MSKAFRNKKAIEEYRERKRLEHQKYLAMFDQIDPTGLGFAENTEHEKYDYRTDF